MFENPAKLIVLGILIGFLLLIVGIFAAALHLRRKRRSRP
jgi:uncharacterized membrane protein HdeD (DUF308 family)